MTLNLIVRLLLDRCFAAFVSMKSLMLEIVSKKLTGTPKYLPRFIKSSDIFALVSLSLSVSL